MFVTVYGATRDILKDFARNLKTSALVYPNGKGIFFVQGYIDSLEALENSFKVDSEDMAMKFVVLYPDYPVSVVWGEK